MIQDGRRRVERKRRGKKGDTTMEEGDLRRIPITKEGKRAEQDLEDEERYENDIGNTKK